MYIYIYKVYMFTIMCTYVYIYIYIIMYIYTVYVCTRMLVQCKTPQHVDFPDSYRSQTPLQIQHLQYAEPFQQKPLGPATKARISM